MSIAHESSLFCILLYVFMGTKHTSVCFYGNKTVLSPFPLKYITRKLLDGKVYFRLDGAASKSLY